MNECYDNERGYHCSNGEYWTKFLIISHMILSAKSIMNTPQLHNYTWIASVNTNPITNTGD